MSRIPRNLIKHLEWTPGKEPPVSPPTPPAPIEPSVSSSDAYWSIDGIQYRGARCRVDLMKTLLEAGVSKTQDQWATHYTANKPNGNFHAPDYPLLYGLLKGMHNIRSDPVHATTIEEARTFLQSSARAKWLMTLTRIQYNPSGRDKIIHNFGTNDRYDEEVDFVGPDHSVKSSTTPQIYPALLGTPDTLAEINSVFNWLNQTDAYLYRVNAKPREQIERVARFYAGSDWAYLDCGRGPQYSYAGLGVRVVRENL